LSPISGIYRSLYLTQPISLYTNEEVRHAFLLPRLAVVATLAITY